MADAPSAASRPRKPLRVLFAYAGPRGSPPGWIVGHPLLRGLVEWTNVAVGARSTIARILAGLMLGQSIVETDVIVTMDYFSAIGVNLRLMAGSARARHVVWGLNQSRRLITQGWLGRLVNLSFRRTDLVITHSSEEAAIFSKLHRIPMERFRFVRWGFDPPTVVPTPLFSNRSEPYVCLIGRNNRDIATFVEGMRGTGMRAVVISNPLPEHEAAAYRAAGVELHADLDFNACFDCIRNAFASAVLLKDSGRGAGHITIVAAAYLGVPQIVSASPVVEEYFTAGTHGLSVPIGDAAAFRAAVLRLRDEPEATQGMREASVRDAHRLFTNDAIAQAFAQVVDEVRVAEPREREISST